MAYVEDGASFGAVFTGVADLPNSKAIGQTINPGAPWRAIEVLVSKKGSASSLAYFAYSLLSSMGCV
jgi:hypothetical protein